MVYDRRGETSPRVWLMPEYAKAWGYPMPEALALGELWMKLYPARYQSIDAHSKARDYYEAFLPRGVDARCPRTSLAWQGSLALATLAIAVASLCFGQYPLS